ncbi:MAG: hypothetical protein KAH56_02395 [Candidatus Krumholzibacteria bacterium]|nr:hypothetical protein [Candidatus Krumholzibacteria bacterium]
MNDITAGRLAMISLLIMTAAVAYAAPATITLPADPPSIRTVELVEQWRIGGEDDEDILLGVIFDAVVGPDGNVYLIDRQLSQVLVISPEGELVTTLGRQGEGPGELNQPHGMLLLDDGKIGVIQGFPGKVIVINPDDTPGGEIHIGGAPEEGGFNFVRDLEKCGDHLVGVRGRASFDMESGKSIATNTLAVMDMEGNDTAIVVEHTQENDLQRRVFDEKAQSSEMDNWAIGPDCILYTTPVRDEYVINARGLDGELTRVMTREFKPRHRNEEDKQEPSGGMVIVMDGAKIENKILDNDPAIMGLSVANDGRLFVRTCFDQDTLLDIGTAGRFDVISPAGEFVEQLTLTVPDFDGDKDRLVFMDGVNFLVIRSFDQAQQAMVAGFGDDEEEDEDLGDGEPLEVVYYRMP